VTEGVGAVTGGVGAVTMGPVTTKVVPVTTTVGAAAVGAAAVGVATVGVVTVGGNPPPIFSAHWQTHFDWVISWYLSCGALQAPQPHTDGQSDTKFGINICTSAVFVFPVLGSGNMTIDVMLIESLSATAWQAFPFLCQVDLWTPLRTAHPTTARTMGAAGESVT